MKKIIYIALVVSTVFYGCDKIEGSQFDDLSKINPGQQKVLVEEFTGHLCGNCPAGAEKLQELKNIYGDNLIIISEHIGDQFAGVLATKYTYDFQTQTGKDLDLIFKIDGSGYPDAFVNRTPLDGIRIIRKNDWATQIQKELEKTPKTLMTVESSYDAGSRVINVGVTINYYKEESLPNENICVYLTEDSIIKYQKDYRKDPEDVANYVHRHVLRGSITPTMGEQISATPIRIGKIITKTFSYTLPEGSDIKPENCSIVAFMTNKNTHEVLQVAEGEVE